MKANKAIFGTATLLAMTATAWAGRATTSATASSPGYGPGTAAATAGYDGNGVGITRTNARTGRVNIAQGVSLGFDENGLSLSTSYAIAPRFGPAIGSTMNVAIGTDGSVAHSVGRTLATGSRTRTVSTAGSAAPGSRGRSPTASAAASGRTGHGGKVISKTHSRTRVSKAHRRVIRKRAWRR